MAKTVVISARVPVDIANMIKQSCKANNMTTSKFLQNMVENPSTSIKKANGGNVIIADNVQLPDVVKGLLSTTGGLGAGTIVYKILQAYLPKDYFTQDQIDGISIGGAIAGGFVGFIAVDKLIEKH